MLFKKLFFRVFSILITIVFILILIGPADAIPDLPTKPAKNDDALPLMQFKSAGHILGFNPKGIYAATGSHLLSVNFLNANGVEPKVYAGFEDMNEAAEIFQHVEYLNLWEGISLSYDSSSDGILRSTYHLNAGADPDVIRLQYNAPIATNKDGSLSIFFENGTMNESRPIAWQLIHDKHIPVIVNFEIYNNKEVGFALDDYDTHYPIIIDPTLTWNTFLGGSGEDQGYAIAVDNNSNAYIGGTSTATWGSPVRNYGYLYDAFVAKLDSSGHLIWNTFLGGAAAGSDISKSIAVDSNGNVYVSGNSDATWGAPVRAYTPDAYGFADTFVAKLDQNGNLIWNTFLGGSSNDTDAGIAVDNNGNIYVSGSTSMGGTWGSPVEAYHGPNDAYAAKLDSNGNLVWNTFIGGNGGSDVGTAIAIYNNSSIYVGGTSRSTWGSPIRAHGASEIEDAFVAKLDSNGNLTWSTFLGSNTERDWGYDIEVDGNENLYFTGTSEGSWGAPIRAYTSGRNAFVGKLNSNGTVIWNTFLGTAWTYGYSIDIDENYNIYAGGSSKGGWARGGISPYDIPFNGGSDDAFIAELSSNGNLIWNTFVGGNSEWDCTHYGEICDVAVNDEGDAYVLGGNIASWGSPVHAFSGGDDVFVAKIINSPVIDSLSRGVSPTSAATADFTLKFSESVTGVDSTDFSLEVSGVTGASIANVSGSGNTYIITINTGNGDGYFRLNIVNDLSIQDLSGNSIKNVTYPYASGELYSNNTYVLIKPPTVSSITRVGINPIPTNVSNISFAVRFSESVTGVNATDFELATSGVLGATISGVSGSGTNYTVYVNTGSGPGSIRLDVSDNDSIIDTDSHPLGGSGAGNGNFIIGETYTIAPSVLSSVRTNSSLTNASSVNYIVTFTEAVTGVTMNDFSLTATGVSGVTISGVSGSGSIYTVTVNTGSGDGTIRLDLMDDDTILDTASNSIPIGGPGIGNGNFTTGETYTIDKTIPTVSSITRVGSNPTAAASVNFTVTFSESVSGVDVGDFSLSSTGVVGATISNVSGSGATRVVKVNTGSGDGTVRLNVIDNDTIVDLAVNPLNSGFTSGEVYTIDKPGLPAPILRSPRTNTVTTNTLPTFWWTNVTSGQTYEIVFATNSAFTNIADSEIVSGSPYTVVTPFSDGKYYWRVRAYNISNQPGAWSSARILTIDTTAPPIPVLSSPAHNESKRRTPIFKWQSTAGATYQFQYDNNSNFSSPIYTVSVRSNFRRPPAMKIGTYYWRVRAKDAVGNWSLWSAPFTINFTRP